MDLRFLATNIGDRSKSNQSCTNVQFNPIVANTPKGSCKWQLVACSGKNGGYNLVDFY
jgi:hypothetical protein